MFIQRFYLFQDTVLCVVALPSGRGMVVDDWLREKVFRDTEWNVLRTLRDLRVAMHAQQLMSDEEFEGAGGNREVLLV
jgi:hypothetical protein